MRKYGAALVVAAAFLAASSGCGGAPPRARGSSSPAPAPVPTSVPTSNPAVPTPTGGSMTAPAAPAGGPVPKGFQVQSATFVSPQQGWVLGTSPCSVAPCTSMVRTGDGGAHWAGVPAPRDVLATSLHQPEAGISEVRFADPRNGWAFGPNLWTTHDGGGSWNRATVASPVSQVVALEVAGGEVDAVVTDCSARSSVCPAQLWHGPVDSDRFSQVAAVTLPAGVNSGGGAGSLFLHGHTGYVVGAPTERPSMYGGPQQLFVTTDGTSWAARVSPCGSDFSLDTVAPLDARGAVALCVGQGAASHSTKMVYATRDGGQTWTAKSNPAPRPGVGGTIIAGDSSTLAVVTASADSWIYRSGDGGSTWTTALQLNDGGEGFGDVGFTTASKGFAVHAPAVRVNQGGATPAALGPDPASLLMTADGGNTWHRVAI